MLFSILLLSSSFQNAKKNLSPEVINMLIDAARTDGDEKLSIPETIKKLEVIQQEMDKEKMAKKAKKAQEELEADKIAETQRATAFLEEENLKNAQVSISFILLFS